jgi:flagellar biosynthetic protein FliR
MANLLSYDASQLLAFILVLIRVGGIVSTAPIFGSSNIPAQIKIVVIIIFSLIIQPFTPTLGIQPTQLHEFVLLVFSELMIGVTLGMVGKFLFAAVEFAGTMTGFQMGLSIANVFDPQSMQQVSLVSRLESIIASLVFLAIDGPAMVVQAMVRSYEVLPVGQAGMNDGLMGELVRLSAGVFTIGFQLGAPLIVALLLANVVLGLLSRSVPQIQIFVVGFPLTLLLGFVFLWIGMPFFIQALRMMFQLFDDQMFGVLQALRLPF